MISHPAAPSWFSCKLSFKHKAAVDEWMTENKTHDEQVHIMTGNQQVFVMFSDEALAAVFKLAFIEHILPE